MLSKIKRINLTYIVYAKSLLNLLESKKINLYCFNGKCYLS